jgi:hypothetical protein
VEPSAALSCAGWPSRAVGRRDHHTDDLAQDRRPGLAHLTRSPAPAEGRTGVITRPSSRLD